MDLLLEFAACKFAYFLSANKPRYDVVRRTTLRLKRSIGTLNKTKIKANFLNIQPTPFPVSESKNPK